MTAKKTVVSLAAALALSASIAGPALAGAPTFDGPVTCISGDELEPMGVQTLSKKEMGQFNKYWVGTTGFCEKGSVDFSAM